MEKQQLKYLSVTRKWGGTEVRKEFDAKIDQWIMQFDEMERDIILELLKHFQYYTSRKLKDSVMQLYKRFVDEFKEISDDVTFIPVYKEYGVGFSDEFYNKFWLINNIYDSSTKNIYGLLQQGEVPKKIAILDDYSGSGKTIKNTIAHCIEENDNCKNTLFYILTIQMSNIALEKILQYAKEQCIEVRILSLVFEKKVFENEKIFIKDIATKKQDEYCKVCLNHKVKQNYYLGYENTQALLSFEYNAPNNTLGLFWHEGEDFFAIFRRHKKRNTVLSQMQREAKQRKQERSKKIIKSHKEDERYIFLMIYLVKQDLKFNYQDACSKFGMSEEQMDEAIGYLLSNKYISMAEGRIKSTNKLKQMISITKISDVKEKNLKEKKVEFSTSQTYIPKNFEKTFGGYKH